MYIVYIYNIIYLYFIIIKINLKNKYNSPLVIIYLLLNVFGL